MCRLVDRCSAFHGSTTDFASPPPHCAPQYQLHGTQQRRQLTKIPLRAEFRTKPAQCRFRKTRSENTCTFPIVGRVVISFVQYNFYINRSGASSFQINGRTRCWSDCVFSQHALNPLSGALPCRSAVSSGGNVHQVNTPWATGQLRRAQTSQTAFAFEHFL